MADCILPSDSLEAQVQPRRPRSCLPHLALRAAWEVAQTIAFLEDIVDNILAQFQLSGI